jgi:hypothetical protein
MKKTILLLTLAAGLTTAVNAQDKSVTFGAKAGLTFPKLATSGQEAAEFPDPQANPSFFVGGYADIAISSQFSIQPGLSVLGKGVKYKQSGTEIIDGDSYTYAGSATISTLYLEVPVNVVGKIPAGSGNVFVGAGPYLGYALSGKTKSKLSISGAGMNFSESDEEDMEFGSGEDEMKRIEFGVNFLGGYELKNGLSINFGYGLGLSNLVNTSGDGKASNRVLSVGLGFRF